MFEGEEHKKYKGVKENVIKKSLTHEDYKDCLFSRRKHITSVNVLRSHLHEMYTEEVNKIALSADENKRVTVYKKITFTPKRMDITRL